MYLYSRESGVPDLGLSQSHPTHMYLYVPHAPLHVPQSAEEGWRRGVRPEDEFPISWRDQSNRTKVEATWGRMVLLGA